MSLVTSNSGSYGESCASDEEECAYLTQNHILHWVRIALSTIIAVIAIAALACEAHAVHYHNQTGHFAERGLVFWPAELDLRSSQAIIACSTIIHFQALAYIIIAFLPYVC